MAASTALRMAPCERGIGTSLDGDKEVGGGKLLRLIRGQIAMLSESDPFRDSLGTLVSCAVLENVDLAPGGRDLAAEAGDVGVP